MSRQRILIVDDEPGVRSALEAILADDGFDVGSAASGESGLEELGRGDYDAVLLDVWLPGIDGLATLREIRERNHEVAVVMISGHGTIETAVRATKLGAFDFVEKPLSLERTLLVLRNALRQRSLERTNRRLLERLAHDTEIVGSSAAAEALRRAVRRAAASDAPVLIRGGRGSGRNALARRIHAEGPRPDGPFVDVACGVLGEAALAEALWGAPPATGRVDLAAGGTLFLEDVDRIAAGGRGPEWAAALDRRGRSSPGFRLVGSTTRGGPELDPALAELLGVLRIEVPSLAERREDIPVLAARLLSEAAKEYGLEPRRLSADCLAALRVHAWPGNLRELRGVMERALVSTPGERIRARDLPEELGGAARAGVDLYGDFATLGDGLQAFQRYHVRRVLAEEQGSLTAAAARLGVSVATLRRRVREL